MGILRRVLLLLVIYSAWLCPLAWAWDIEDYTVNIQLERDSSFMVTEEIHADFGYESKHGIFRDIPTTYNNEKGQPYHVSFNVTGVQDAQGHPWEYAEENKPNFRRIRIGRADRTVSGEQIYVITYRVRGAVQFFPDHDELYWNAIGTRWDVMIRHAYVTVNLPSSVAKGSIRLATFTGPQGSTTSNAKSEIITERSVAFEGEAFLPHEGFTIVVGVPQGTLVPPDAFEQAELYQEASSAPDEQNSSAGILFLLIPLLTFGGMFITWLYFGRDPQMNKSVVVEYKVPGNLGPAEMGALIDSKVDQRDISSAVIDLAVRGYLRIEQKKSFLAKDYTFVCLKDFAADMTLKPYEKEILRGIFSLETEPSLADLKNHFYQRITSIETKINEELKQRKYFDESPVDVKTRYFVAASLVGFLVGLIIPHNFWPGIALELSVWIIYLFGIIMPRKTTAGAEISSRILGFKEFLARTEKDSIQRAEQQDIFERMLPYAICLGMSTAWAKKFAGLYTQPPAWFHGNSGDAFVYDHFIHDLDHSLNAMSTAFYSSPQAVSSGGGFAGGGSSGGGFGGGGGGSW